MIQWGKVTRQWLAEQNWGMPVLATNHYLLFKKIE
jgi:hypothetical protein